MKALRFPAYVPRMLLRVASVLLLVQGAAAWASLLGLLGEAAVGAADFAAMDDATRALLVLNAVLCLVAAIGAWFISEWGPVLWFAVVASLGVAVTAGVPDDGRITSLLVVHLLLAAAWLATASRVERRGGEGPFGG